MNTSRINELEELQKVMLADQNFNGLSFFNYQIEELQGKSKEPFTKIKFINIDIKQKYMTRFW
jgi:hypothetical protein